ncbi:hypothetical protein KDW_25800 [Dictyobacter vulcani]|uniref:Uncharacterized protein n=1 Tax=Dictyobacter vulcani TaxID=2607529 RepID=A0A5J4KFW9_9CHLR|nr:hypothetical protein [Dictyobacter vulcani]GER88418.1 hypothetical protein KDW_25800 [Dictyobacter vulcani]
MIENMAINESDNTPAISKPLHIQFARFISTILSPAVVALPFVVLMGLSASNQNVLFSVIITIFFLCVGPMAYITFGVMTGKFTDVDVSVRSQRRGTILIWYCLKLAWLPGIAPDQWTKKS